MRILDLFSCAGGAGMGYHRAGFEVVGVEEYVEAYEHRIAAGRPPAPLEVHHKNRDKQDNRPENLVVLTKREHALLHQRENADDYAARRAARGGHKSWQAFEKAQRSEARRSEIRARSERMREAYESGATTIEVGELFGIDASNVSRNLRRIGTTMRTPSAGRRDRRG